MPKDAAVTIRLPDGLKRQLQLWAKRERRSLSAEIVARLERQVADTEPVRGGPGRLLGVYKSGVTPSDADFAAVRRSLWGRLGRPQARRAS